MKPRIFANKERFVNYLKKQELIDAQKSVEAYVEYRIMPFMISIGFCFINDVFYESFSDGRLNINILITYCSDRLQDFGKPINELITIPYYINYQNKPPSAFSASTPGAQ